MYCKCNKYFPTTQKLMARPKRGENKIKYKCNIAWRKIFGLKWRIDKTLKSLWNRSSKLSEKYLNARIRWAGELMANYLQLGLLTACHSQTKWWIRRTEIRRSWCWKSSTGNSSDFTNTNFNMSIELRKNPLQLEAWLAGSQLSEGKWNDFVLKGAIFLALRSPRTPSFSNIFKNEVLPNESCCLSHFRT